MESSPVQFAASGAGRCLSCGQFAGDGHTCPIRRRAFGAAVDLYGVLGVPESEVRRVQRSVAAELGGRSSEPAQPAAAEDALNHLSAAADQLAARGGMTAASRDQLDRRIEQSWMSLRAGEALSVGDVAALHRLQELHGAPVAPGSRRAFAERQLTAAKVQLGLAALRHRRGGDPGEYVTALARRDEAARELVRAQAAEQETASRCPSCGQFAGAGHTCPTPAGMPSGAYGDTRGDARTKEMLDDLQSAVAAIVQSGQLQRWMDAMASNGLHKWSFNNRLLALIQLAGRGEALDQAHLMGFRQWEKFNRHVRKGEKAIWILAPVTRKIRHTHDDGTVSTRVVVAGFKSVPVFNISQTDGAPLPDPPVRPAAGQATPGTIDGLKARVCDAGYRYREETIPDCRPETGSGTLGYTDPQAREIVVDARLNPAQKASTIAHELGHVHCGHVDSDFADYRKHRGRMETEAEMTAYMVNRARGMSRVSAESFSPGYIASWSRGQPEVITAAMDRSVKAFNKIMDGDWPTT